MTQQNMTPEKPADRAPIFFRMTLAVLALSLLGAVAGAVWVMFAAKTIDHSGGWGWLLVGAAYLVGFIVVCFACALCSAISIYRREPHRTLSILILVFSGLVVIAFGTTCINVAMGEHKRRDERARASKAASEPTAHPIPRPTGAPAAGGNSNAPALPQDDSPQILELKSKIEEAIRNKNPDGIVDCFFIEERFNTPEIRRENRDQVEVWLRGDITKVETREIPAKELVEFMKRQRAKPGSGHRYSLDPKMMLRIWSEARDGSVGRSFPIGEKNGKWYIVTVAGHTT